ncbi:hypothetical protein EW146_g1554 [Bondarzewia mesenterica]|uniref:Retrovirus-related Pol polyprotein from transposon TNT 1-94-like beta-barrel domain-containing protein n=1 Tax=Bondarzewia mesenterica TaxID=1095465 RepID=A0A4S4M9M7_9AGAM|nr:hypothetical protein EW146_g1554 [Bondarzewia mesenterica]
MLALPILPTGPVLPPSQASPYSVTPLSAFFPIYPPTAPAGAGAPVTYAATNTECSGLHTAGSAADAWRSLRNRFELRDPIVVQDMRMRLASTWYVDGTVVTEHFKTLRMLRDTANRAGAAISEGEFCQMALMTFPVDGVLGTVVMTLLTCQDSMVAESVLSSQEAQIRASALRRTNLPAVGNSPIVAGTALVATQRPRCGHCNKLGHPTDKCWVDGGAAEHRRPEWWGRRRNRGQNTESDGTTHHDANLALGPNITFVASHNPPMTTGLAIYSDSGAMFHYFADRRDFVIYEPLSQPAEGRAAGPGGFTVAGKGIIVKDAIIQGKRVTRTLSTIHAPDMGQNLLSTRQFDHEGGRVWTKGGRTVVVDATGRHLFESMVSTSGLHIIQSLDIV